MLHLNLKKDIFLPRGGGGGEKKTMLTAWDSGRSSRWGQADEMPTHSWWVLVSKESELIRAPVACSPRRTLPPNLSCKGQASFQCCLAFLDIFGAIGSRQSWRAFTLLPHDATHSFIRRPMIRNSRRAGAKHRPPRFPCIQRTVWCCPVAKTAGVGVNRFFSNQRRNSTHFDFQPKNFTFRVSPILLVLVTSLSQTTMTSFRNSPDNGNC